MRTLLSCTLAVSMYLPCTNVYATDTVDNLEKKTNELSSELSKVNEELSTLSSELDSTISKVESTTNAIELTKVSLADAQAKEVQQYSDCLLYTSSFENKKLFTTVVFVEIFFQNLSLIHIFNHGCKGLPCLFI